MQPNQPIDLSQITISPFRPQDQADVRALILAGLGEHWGFIDHAANPDLDNIAYSYADDVFLVAWLGKSVVGTGALRRERDGVGRIVRMSVKHTSRRCGVGTKILDRLVEEGRKREYCRLVLETTATWDGVKAFYRHNGFAVTHDDGKNVHFVLELIDDQKTDSNVTPAGTFAKPV